MGFKLIESGWRTTIHPFTHFIQHLLVPSRHSSWAIGEKGVLLFYVGDPRNTQILVSFMPRTYGAEDERGNQFTIPISSVRSVTESIRRPPQ